MVKMITPARFIELRKLSRMATTCGGDSEDKELVSELLDAITALNVRRMDLAAQVALLEAKLSAAQETVSAQQMAVQQHFRDSSGHNHCVVNNPRLWAAFGLRKAGDDLPPREEFEAGCVAFQDALYGAK